MSAANLCMFLFSLLGLACSIIANETCFDYTTLTYTEPCARGTPFKWASVACLLVMDVALVFYYTVRARAKMVRWFYASPAQAFFRSYLWLQFLAELVVFQIQPYPIISAATDVGLIWSNKIVVVMLLRIYLLFRVAHDYSPLFRQVRELCIVLLFSFSLHSFAHFAPVRLYQTSSAHRDSAAHEVNGWQCRRAARRWRARRR